MSSRGRNAEDFSSDQLQREHCVAKMSYEGHLAVCGGVYDTGL